MWKAADKPVNPPPTTATSTRPWPCHAGRFSNGPAVSSQKLCVAGTAPCSCATVRSASFRRALARAPGRDGRSAWPSHVPGLLVYSSESSISLGESEYFQQDGGEGPRAVRRLSGRAVPHKERLPSLWNELIRAARRKEGTEPCADDTR